MADVNLDWGDVVGTDNAGQGQGYYGDLMRVGEKTLQALQDSGQLTEEAAGVAYAQLIDSSMSKAIQFETAIAQLRLSKLGSGGI